MNIHKKVMMMAVTASLFMAGSAFASKCASCAEKMAIRQSIKDAQAAAIAASKPTARHIDTLEQGQDAEGPCCASCAEGGPCEEKKCPCGKPGKEPKKSADWVAVDSSDSSSCCAQMNKLQCVLNTLAENKCCKKVKDLVKEQGQAAERCCRHVRNELDEIEDLIISQTDAAAVCCSVTEAHIGDPCISSVVDILDLLDLSPTQIDTINTTCLDTLTLLKSIYALVAQILLCNPCQIP